MKILKFKAKRKIPRQLSNQQSRFLMKAKISQRKVSFNYLKAQMRLTMGNQIKLVKLINQKNMTPVQLLKPTRMPKPIRKPQMPMLTTSLLLMLMSHLEEMVLLPRKLLQHQLPNLLFLMKLQMLSQQKSPRKIKAIKIHKRALQSQPKTKSKKS